MEEQLSFIEEKIPAYHVQAERIYHSFQNAINSLNRGYNLSVVALEGRPENKPPEYYAIMIAGNTAFTIKGKNQVYLYVQPRLRKVFEQSNCELSKIKSTPWQRTPAKGIDFEMYPKVAADIFDESLRENGFGCCSRYEECSDAKHCIHPDVMFSGMCAYKYNLKDGKIFYGKNKNI